MIIDSYKLLIKKRSNIAVIFGVTALVMVLYYLALIQSSPFDIFLKANSNFFIIGQIALSFINAFLVGFSIALFLEIFNKQKDGEKSSIIGTFVALFFSIATTGCYVCGSVLLPVVGIAASFGTLPFAGLEIKVITILFLLYSVNQLAKNYLGLCEIKSYKTYKLNSGEVNLNFNFSFIDKLRPLFISFLFIVVIYSLPVIIPDTVSANINPGNPYACGEE